MRPADDILGPDAEAVVAGLHEDGAHVVSRAGHGLPAVALVILQREAHGPEVPAHRHRRAAGKYGRVSEKAQQSVWARTKSKEGQAAMNSMPFPDRTPSGPGLTPSRLGGGGEQQWIAVGTPRGFQAVRQTACTGCWGRPSGVPGKPPGGGGL